MYLLASVASILPGVALDAPEEQRSFRPLDRLRSSVSAHTVFKSRGCP